MFQAKIRFSLINTNRPHMAPIGMFHDEYCDSTIRQRRGRNAKNNVASGLEVVRLTSRTTNKEICKAASQKPWVCFEQKLDSDPASSHVLCRQYCTPLGRGRCRWRHPRRGVFGSPLYPEFGMFQSSANKGPTKGVNKVQRGRHTHTSARLAMAAAAAANLVATPLKEDTLAGDGHSAVVKALRNVSAHTQRRSFE
jgi:hypothetical protein